MIMVGAFGLEADHLFSDLEHAVKVPTPRRVFALAKAIDDGFSIDRLYKLTGIDPWFLQKVQNIRRIAKLLRESKALESISSDLMGEAKKAGFSDKQIALAVSSHESYVRRYRKGLGIIPVVKQIDTLAAEFPAQTNYLYLTYWGDKDDVSFVSPESRAPSPEPRKAVVLGSGPYCIGSSVEFDWCCVSTVKAFRKKGIETIMINYNPETVSTDYDECDRLYFDELSLERVLDICDKENPDGTVVSMGGQIPNNLSQKLDLNGVKIMGTPVESIDKAESRDKFSALCDELGIDQPLWKAFVKIEDAFQFAEKVGYPVLVRPSYVLSGAAMSVAHNKQELQDFLGKAVKISTEAPVVISKFEVGAREIEMDAVAHEGKILIYAISEHVENAGVHSGDATIVLPPQKTYLETLRRVKKIGKQVAKSLDITGPFNIQFLAKDNRIKVIECNLRASRSFPFVSKVTKHNFIEIAANAMLGDVDHEIHYQTVDLDYVAVKFPQFSFTRLKGADPVMGVEMASTGEVACFGDDLEEAFLKGFLATGGRLPKKNILVSVGRIEDKVDMLDSIRTLVGMGYSLFATFGTSIFLSENGIQNTLLHKVSYSDTPNIGEYLDQRKLDLAIVVPSAYASEELTDGYTIRRRAVDRNMPLITNVQVAKTFVRSIEKYKLEDLKIKDWDEYRN